MFYRQAFVTNSSSTSFIFFGVRFKEVDDETIINLLPPENVTKETYEREDLGEQFYYWAEGLKGPIGVYVDWESQDGVVYLRDSFMHLEGRFDEIPVDMILKSEGKRKVWAKEILDFCKAHGLTPVDYRDKEAVPKWRVALEVNE